MAPRRRGRIYWVAGVALAGLASLGVGLSRRHTRLADRPAASAMAPPAPAATAPTLDKTQREYLWKVEHNGLVLAQVGYAPLASALAGADEPALERLLASDFRGQVPSQPREVRADTDVVHVLRRQDDGSPPRALAGKEFLAELLALRRGFTGTPKVKFSLMSLAPESRTTPDGRWRGSALLRLAGEAAPGQPREVLVNLAYTIEPPDEAGYARGGWLHECTISQTSDARSVRPLFREVAAARGLNTRTPHDNWETREGAPLTVTGGVYLCDHDRDGRLDVLITDINGHAFYRGLEGGRFKDVTVAVGLPPGNNMGIHLTATFADLDGDGWEDLILGDSMYRNDQGRQFVLVPPERTNLKLPAGGGTLVAADYDRDGRVDLYLVRAGHRTSASWLDGKAGDGIKNELWRNLGDWQFLDVTDSAGADGGNRSSFTALWLDADDDGWPDLYVPNEFGNGVLLVNRGDGTFRSVALVEHPSDFGTMGATCGDIDNDGRIDIYAANMYSKAGSRVIGNLATGTYPEPISARLRSFVAGSQLHHNRGGLAFEQWGAQCQVAAVGWAYGPALADLDNDGWLDLYATCGFISQTRDKPDG
jgi:hypothetical protein